MLSLLLTGAKLPDHQKDPMKYKKTTPNLVPRAQAATTPHASDAHTIPNQWQSHAAKTNSATTNTTLGVHGGLNPNHNSYNHKMVEWHKQFGSPKP